ncbi:phosphate:Na+ symporter [Tindallia magadiensis]|uniref:Phosphate:Na+ symporter n=1 Tax=Tindallia magadiensis TaxID=69895 RepID=A0A1I3HAM1_9FIRM|nr:Na/Pi cotransporter family protein [Tindallia magadiensis]SFI32711.1 phosphate:Na+ symporter [Tindallia magadiensis]
MFFSLALGLLGGLGLFLYGMKQMSTGMQKAAGEKLHRILEILTANPYMATLTGIIVTVLVQSSSTTNVMAIGFASAGLMNLSQTVGTMLGANIGTTVTAQLISFDISVIIYPAIALGAYLNLFTSRGLHKAIGQAILGIGLLFLGLNAMSDAMIPLREYAPFVNMLARFGQTPVLGMLAGALFTAVIQSSSATAGVVIALTLQGIIDTPSSIAIVLGANIGTSITAAIASIGTNLTARRSVLAIVTVKVTGVILALIFFQPFLALVSLTGSSVTRQVANAHTIFNILNVLLFFPFLTPFLRQIQKLMPGEEIVVETGSKYLNPKAQKTTSLAISAARQELLRMAAIARGMLQDSVRIFVREERGIIGATRQKEELIDSLEKDITIFLTGISQKALSSQQSQTITALLHCSSDLERIGDHAHNIIHLAELKMDERLPFSEEACIELEQMHQLVDEMIEGAMEAFEKEDTALARKIIAKDHDVDSMERNLRKGHIERLNQKVCRPQSGVVFLDIISNLERVADHATNMAEVVTGDF